MVMSMRPLRPDAIYRSGVLQPFAARLTPGAGVQAVASEFIPAGGDIYSGDAEMVDAGPRMAPVEDRVDLPPTGGPVRAFFDKLSARWANFAARRDATRAAKGAGVQGLGTVFVPADPSRLTQQQGYAPVEEGSARMAIALTSGAYGQGAMVGALLQKPPRTSPVVNFQSGSRAFQLFKQRGL